MGMKIKLFAGVSWIVFIVSAAGEWGLNVDLPLTPTFWLLVAIAIFLVPATRGATVTQVAAGQQHAVFVESDGSLWGMGQNFDGELGLGFGGYATNTPVQIIASNVTSVACGEFHTLFRQSDGSLWAMGYNGSGQLGDGTNVSHFFPEKVVASGVTTIAAGGEHSLFRTSSGSPLFTVGLWGMGENTLGELGDGTTNNQYSAELLQSTASVPNQVSTMSCGAFDSFFVKHDGSLWAMGDNASGQLGDGTTSGELSPERILSNNVVAVAAGGNHTLFLKSDGTLWGMGNDAYGQLGDNSFNQEHSPEEIGINVSAIAAGADHSLFLKTDGSLWAMGYNADGELGCFTSDFYTNLPVQVVASNVVAIAAGLDNSFFIKSDGSLWGMGSDAYGTLGDAGSANVIAPTRIVPPPPSPSVTGMSVAGNNVTLNCTNGLLGATYFTLTSTNITLPMNQWTRIATNQLSADGSFNIVITNGVIPGASQQFYRVQLVY